MNTVPEDKKALLFYGYVIVAAAFVIILMSYGVRTSFGVFFKPIITEFEWSRGLTSGAVTLSMLLQGLWGIVMGRVNDRIGSRWVATLCCLLLGTGLLLMSLTHSPWHLYLFYGVIVGLGMGGIFVALVSTVARWFQHKRGLMTGVVMAGIGTGTLIFAPLCNWLISTMGWKSSCLALGGFILVTGTLTAQLLRREPAGIIPADANNDPTSGPKKGTATGLALKQAIATSQFWIMLIVFACLGYCTFTITVHLVPHITDLEISAAIAASVLAVTGGVQSLGGIVLGLVADRIHSKKVLAISLVLITGPLFWLVSIASVPAFFLFAVLHSFGIGGGTAMESTLVAEIFGLKSHGVILGCISFGFTVGAAVGPFITGYLFDLTGSYQTGFLVCAATGIIGLMLTFLLRPSPHGYFSRG
ncbi:MAG: MFS transporter [Dehalococcoidales bacterium]|nr:MFS transporter [Dehalococcoidales bacterium]